MVYSASTALISVDPYRMPLCTSSFVGVHSSDAHCSDVS